jgi:prepilin peptidase CpaA
MSNMIDNSTVLLVLLALLAGAALIDLRQHRIPNACCVAIVLTGVALQLALAGTAGLVAALSGLIAGGALLLPFHLWGGMGAGDVKLMAAVGTSVGPFGALAAGIFALIAGVAIALGLVSIRTATAVRQGTGLASAVQANRGVRFPFAAAIGIGTCTWIFGVSQSGALT